MILAGDPLHAAHDLHGPLAVQLVEGEIQDRRDLLLPANTAIAMLPDGGLNAAAGLRRNVRATIDDLRHGGDGHPGLLGNERNRGSVAGPWASWSDRWTHGDRV